MRLNRNFILYFFLCFFTCLINLSLVGFFLIYFKAEGFSVILLCWTFIVSLLFFVVGFINTFSKQNKKIKILNIIFQILLILIISVGVLALLIQLSVSQRSLAEAWLESTRKGSPFGFFSFFAAEIYAVLLLPSVYLISVKKYINSVLIAISVNTLCYAIIYSNQILFLLAFLLVISPFFIHKKWQKFFIPLIASSLFALLCTVGCVNKKINTSFVSIDLSKVMNKLAPDFPLMVHIPGYGYSVGSAKPKNSVNLSPRTIFSVQGEPLQTLYFEENRLKNWDGNLWNKYYSQNKNGKVKFFFSSQQDDFLSLNPNLQKITLTLQDDFFTTIPLLESTVAIQLSKEYETSRITSIDANVISIIPSIIKGTQIKIFNDFNHFDEQTPIESQSKISPKIKEFAKQICFEIDSSIYEQDEKFILTEDQQTEFINRILNYFSREFTYSQKTTQTPRGIDPYENFLLNTKTGFCTWFAGTFTLLMHTTNIPCRIAEGYRVLLDEKGEGKISGKNSHAWAEIFIEGKWKTIETTPIYFPENQEITYEQEDVKSQEEKEKINSKIIIEISSIILFCVIFVILFILLRNQTLVQKAKSIVRYYNKKGIESPQEIGWLLWKEKVNKNIHIPKEKKKITKAIKISNEMMKIVYEL